MSENNDEQIFIGHRRKKANMQAQTTNVDSALPAAAPVAGPPSAPPAGPPSAPKAGPPSAPPAAPVAGPPTSFPKLAPPSAPPAPPKLSAPPAAPNNNLPPVNPTNFQSSLKQEAGSIFDQRQAKIIENERLRNEEVAKRVAAGERKEDVEKDIDSRLKSAPITSLNKPQDKPNGLNGAATPSNGTTVDANAATKSAAELILDKYLEDITDHTDFDDDLRTMKEILLYYASAKPLEVVNGKSKIEDYLIYHNRIGQRVPKINEYLHNALNALFVKGDDSKKESDFDSVADFVISYLEKYYTYFRKRGGKESAWQKAVTTLDKVLKKVEGEKSPEGEDLRDYYESLFIVAYLLSRKIINELKPSGENNGSSAEPIPPAPIKLQDAKQQPAATESSKGGALSLDDVAPYTIKLLGEKYFDEVLKTVKKVEKFVGDKFGELQKFTKEKLEYFEQKLGSRKLALIDLITANQKDLNNMVNNESQYKIFKIYTEGEFFKDTRKEYLWLKQNIVKETDGSFDSKQALDFNIVVPGFEKPMLSDLITFIMTYTTNNKIQGFEGVKSNHVDDLLKAYVEFKAILLDTGLVDEWYTELKKSLTK